MSSASTRVGIIAVAAILLFACNDPLRGPVTGSDSSIGVDSSAGDGGGDATTDGSPTDTGGRTDSSTPTDSATGGDGSVGLGQCDPSCLAAPGAVCCTTCGSCNLAEVMCEPFCASGQRWDCELNCCFDTTTFMCVE